MKRLGVWLSVVVCVGVGMAQEKPAPRRWEDIGLPAKLTLQVRDLWRHENGAAATGFYEAPVARHGVVMVK